MQLVRKDNGAMISDQCTNRSGWYDEALGVVPWRTVGGVRRVQRKGVRYSMQDVTLLFGPGYANSNNAGYNRLVNASIDGTTLVFTDAAGVQTDVKVDAQGFPGKEGVSRWEEVPTKDLRYVTVSLYAVAYTAV